MMTKSISKDENVFLGERVFLKHPVKTLKGLLSGWFPLSNFEPDYELEYEPKTSEN